jgi:hypothetical protein
MKQRGSNRCGGIERNGRLWRVVFSRCRNGSRVVSGSFVAAAIDELNVNGLRTIDGVVCPKAIPTAEKGESLKKN